MNSSPKKHSPNINIQADTLSTFAMFFDTYKYNDARQQLTNCIETCLSTENEHYETALDRANLLCFYHQLEDLLNAAYFLNNNKKQ